jgi:colanic acid/amylovoran biosynthesis glycosyltransferase
MSEPTPVLIYRDRIGAPSEIGFLRRQYLGFTRLRPVWIGRTLLPQAEQISPDVHRLGGSLPLGPLRRLLFRHFGIVPPVPVAGLAPVLHAQFARGGALALPLARALGLRLVVTLHGGDVSKQKNWRGTVLARRWPALVREAARFICVSHAVAEIAAARGAPAEKLLVLPIGVEVPDQPSPAAAPTSHLFVGRFVEKKGILTLADAISRLRARGDTTPITCVGDGPLRPALEALARETTGITLTGWLPPDAVRAHMTRAVSLLVPSVVANDGDAEGLPSVIPEAMAQACPVIGSDQGGIAEAIRHDTTGLLVPPGDADALAAAMHRIATQPALRQVLGRAGYAYAATDLNARIQSVRLETLLLSL